MATAAAGRIPASALKTDFLEKNASSVSRLPKTIKKRPGGGSIVYRHALRRIAAGILGDYSRLSHCGRTPVAGHITLIRSANGAHYAGISTCGSVWNCPVCAAKIAEAKREEIEALFAGHEATGGGLYMLTLTLPHKRAEPCASTRRTVADSWRKVQAGRAWGALKAKHGIIHHVRALEVTHGENGWHPHLHIVFLTSRPLDVPAHLHRDVAARWADKVEADSGKVVEFIATDLRPAKAAEYIAKWGSASEVAKGEFKQARGKGRSPWQLLEAYRDGDKQAGPLFKEYTKAFYRARHLTYSKGCREAYGLRAERSDEEMAQGPEIQDELTLYDVGRQGPIGVINQRAWGAVLSWNLSGQLLAATIRDGFEGAAALMEMHDIEFTASAEDFQARPPDKKQPAAHFHRDRNRKINREYFQTMKDASHE